MILHSNQAGGVPQTAFFAWGHAQICERRRIRILKFPRVASPSGMPNSSGRKFQFLTLSEGWDGTTQQEINDDLQGLSQIVGHSPLVFGSSRQLTRTKRGETSWGFFASRDNFRWVKTKCLCLISVPRLVEFAYYNLFQIYISSPIIFVNNVFQGFGVSWTQAM